MRPVLLIVAGALLSWVALAFFLNRETALAVLFGMLGPLSAVSLTWILAGRTYERDPAALTSLMVAAFAGKLVFFGVYVTVMLRVLLLRPGPFVVSFTSYFIVLYVIEALHLQRLFWRGMRASR